MIVAPFPPPDHLPRAQRTPYSFSEPPFPLSRLPTADRKSPPSLPSLPLTPAQAKHYIFLQERVLHHLTNGNRPRASHIAARLAEAVLRNHRDPPADSGAAIASGQSPIAAAPVPAAAQAPKPAAAPVSAPASPPAPRSSLLPPAAEASASPPSPTEGASAKSAPADPQGRQEAEGGIGGRLDHGDHASLRFEILFQAADFFFEDGDHTHAAPLFREALLVVEHHPEAVDPLEVAHIHHNYASFFDATGDEISAESHYQQALEILDGFDPKPLEQIANVANNLAMIARNRNDLEQAEANYLRALEIFEELRGPEHLDVAVVCNNLGSLYWAWHHSEMARDLHRRALSIRRKLLDDHHADVGQSACNLAAVYHDLKDFEKADRHYQRGLKILREHIDEDPDSYRAVAQNYAELLTENDKEKKGQQLLAKVEKLLKAAGKK